MLINISKGRERKNIRWTALLLLTTITLLVTSCRTPANRNQNPNQEIHDPFSARRESEDGVIVAWSGNTKGYEPGAEVVVDVTIQNETDQSWQGRYCLQLLNCQSHEVVASLEQGTFTLESGVGLSDTIAGQLPEDLDEGGYALSLAVRRPGSPMVDLVPIQVGEVETGSYSATEQDMDASLQACP